MSTTLLSTMQELSKQLGDSWQSTTTSGGSSTTLIDTALMAKANNWISSTQEMYDLITSGTYIDEERKISSLSNTAGTLTMLAHGGTIATSVNYEIHRMFRALDKKTALIRACRDAYPHIHEKVEVSDMRIGNWLKNGDSFRKWTVSTTPDDWTVATVTAAQSTTAPYYQRGVASALKLTIAGGSVKQTNTNNPRLNDLAGKTVTFRVRGWCNTASCLRIAVYDGITRTYSSFHDGDSAWDSDDTLYVNVKIADEATQVAFEIYVDAVATTYVTDARVISDCAPIYIGYLGLVNNMPNVVEQGDTGNWSRMHDWSVDEDGYLHMPSGVNDLYVHITGYGLLDFLASGVSSTSWAATVNINTPQTDILIAQAAVILYTTISLPNFDTGISGRFATAIGYWEAELAKRIQKFHMPYYQISKIWR
jgi:hypothetical protein